MQALCLPPQFLCIHMCAGSVVFRESDFLCVLHPPLFLQTFCFPSTDFPSPKKRDLQRQLGLSVSKFLSFCTFFFNPMYLCIGSTRLQDECSLIMTEKSTDTWMYQNVIKINFSATFSFRITEQNRSILLWLIYLDYLVSCSWPFVQCVKFVSFVLFFWDRILFMNLGVEFRIILLRLWLLVLMEEGKFY